MEEVQPSPQERPDPFEVVDLIAWHSLNRPAWSFSTEAIRTIGAIAVLVSLILAFIQEWLAIVVVWASFFLFYALNKVPPTEVEHKITNRGIISMGRSYVWADLGPFWFSHKKNDVFLHVATKNVFGQLMIMVHPDNWKEIRNILAEYLPYIENVEKTVPERMADWFSRKFPLDKMIKKDFTDKPKENTGLSKNVPPAEVESTSQPSEGHTLSS